MPAMRLVAGTDAGPMPPTPDLVPEDAQDDTLLDRLPNGMLVLGRDAVVRYANRAARIALAAGAAGLRLDGKTVAPVESGAHAGWLAALAAAESGEVRMMRLGVPGHRPVSLSPCRLRSGRAAVLCTLPAGEVEEAGALAAYARAHGLSAAESDVLVALARGANPKTIARQRGSTEGTVRSQIKTILLKTGFCGIRELVVDALRSAPVPIDA
jgi:DNA-binding CsgD family transcriptional regulator